MKYISLIFLFLMSVSAEERPNIILMIADDLGFVDMSFKANSSPDVKTSGIDRLAKSGVHFSTAYAMAPICSPSRAGLITGRYQQRWGNYWYGQGGLPLEEYTIPKALKELGYITKKVGKNHMNGGPGEHPQKHGFDEFFGFIDHTWDFRRLSQKDVDAYGAVNAKKAHIGPLERNGEKVSFEDAYTTDLFADESIEFIERNKAKPFFLQLSFNAVHHPTYVGHPKYLKKYGIEQFPFWDPKKESYKSWHSKWGHMGEIDPDGRKRYLATLDCMDDAIDRLMAKLDELDLTENTMVIFMSDNGGTINTYANNGPLNGFKYMFGEGGIRIPIIISWPKRIQAAEKSQVVSAMDIFPTILDAVGKSKPENLDGISLFEVIEKDKKIYDFICWSDGKGKKVIRRGKYKLVETSGWKHKDFKTVSGKQLQAEDYIYPAGTLLFDLEKDPGERKNLANQYPELVKELKQLYKNWRSKMGEPVRAKKNY